MTVGLSCAGGEWKRQTGWDGEDLSFTHYLRYFVLFSSLCMAAVFEGGSIARVSGEGGFGCLVGTVSPFRFGMDIAINTRLFST